MVGISLASFVNKNYSTVFSQNIDKDLSNKLTKKIFSTISLGAISNIDNIQKNSNSIIPLTEDKIISYAIIFKNPKDIKQYFSLSFSIESDKQLILYKRIPILETLTKEFIVELKENFFSITDPPKLKVMLRNVIETANDLFQMDSLAEDPNEVTPLMNFIAKFGKNIAGIYRSILLYGSYKKPSF